MKESETKQVSARAAAYVWLVTLSFLIGLVVWMILSARPAYQVVLTDVSWIGGGQLCPEPLFDAQGNSYPGIMWGNISAVAYKGPAPMYAVDASNFPSPPSDNTDPCWFPEKISPDIAVQGTAIYPLVLTAKLVNHASFMKKGESTKLSAEAYIADQFPGEKPENSEVFGFPDNPSLVRNVEFSLFTTNFEYTPPDEPVRYAPLSIAQPAHEVWIISPKEGAVGEQNISVAVTEQGAEYDMANADVTVTVKEISGLNPSFVASLSAAGTFLLGLFGILKIIPETMSLWGKPVTKEKADTKDKPAG